MITDICIRELQAIENSSTTFTARDNLDAFSDLQIYTSNKFLLLTWITISEIRSPGIHIILKCCLYFIYGTDEDHCGEHWTQRGMGLPGKWYTWGRGEGNDLAGVAFFPPWLFPIFASREETQLRMNPTVTLFLFCPFTTMANNAVCYTSGECKLFLIYLI